MANTPFELYEEAYRLHYREKNLPEAVKIYEAIVRDFPDAHECGYAFIQLQKIKANETTSRLLHDKEFRFSHLVVPGLAISCLALLVAICGLLVTMHGLRTERDRVTLATAALARMDEGKNREAGVLIEKIRAMDPGDELVGELAAANKPRVSEPAATRPAPDSASIASPGKMKKNAPRLKPGRIRGFRPTQHAVGQPITPTKPETTNLRANGL